MLDDSPNLAVQHRLLRRTQIRDLLGEVLPIEEQVLNRHWQPRPVLRPGETSGCSFGQASKSSSSSVFASSGTGASWRALIYHNAQRGGAVRLIYGSGYRA